MKELLHDDTGFLLENQKCLMRKLCEDDKEYYLRDFRERPYAKAVNLDVERKNLQ